MIEARVAKRYAAALFALARRSGIERIVWDDLLVLREVLRDEPRLAAVLAAPQVSDRDKQRLLKAALADAHPAVQGFVLLAVAKGRSAHFADIIEAYGHLLDEAMGIADAMITSAVPLAPSDVDRIVRRLAQMTGKTIRHTLMVDPAIMGGVVAVVGDEIIDHSVRNDLGRLRDRLRALKVHDAA